MGQTSSAPVGLSPPTLGRNPHCNDGAVGKGGWKSWLLHLSDATPLTTEGQSGDPGWLPAVQGGIFGGKEDLSVLAGNDPDLCTCGIALVFGDLGAPVCLG